MRGATPLYDGPVVDAHQHFWDPVRNHHPWLTEEGVIPFRYGDYAAIRRPFLPPEYRTLTRGHRVVATVYVETEWDPTDPIGEVRYAEGLAREHGLPNAIVAQAWLDREDVGEVLRSHGASGLVRSVRHKPGGPASVDDVGASKTLMSSDAWRRGYALLHPNGLHFDLQTPWWNAEEALALALDFPETTIILNHLCLPADRSEDALLAWRQGLERMAQAPNVRCKISGFGRPGRGWTVEDNARIVREAIAIFGAGRAMFASNFPVDSLCVDFDTLYRGFKTIVSDLPATDQFALFAGTAAETYGVAIKVSCDG
ncbi:amidohydrolase family protein [Aureimonas phyllosphaerae]|uniref:Putative TIM-barrel fold metal-dependent hydrolase n=1 Tax=Aureimonas phyllosphaerae TaxID=1166078 RepID=A0A7W6C0Q0_9HYPH|nr:amidohydrolase family protein [Aureimonas phyllosphaerae]MBB3937256.1 putative TIM-barrel fold metal-dependent hydrolase [Aureimonas phyllosphaerae]MBB3961263.1 putative TIM-barrel fold metal-dependent hydrolase [Aureimonas phyllosphaerae]SFF58153.1 Predicted metal-dependent hydrolase, TIM-barrel fold [Aureimonas phyllosphaerae]